MRYPWTITQWQGLVQRFEQQQLSHALLFNGIAGLGKLQIAQDFAQLLLCENPQNESACQNCRPCKQFIAQTHPDYELIQPEEVGKAIKIDQVRGLIEKFSLAGHYTTHRIAIICPAENLNLAAANSLLKLLEEPPPQSLFILVCSNISALPATILSRCQQVRFTAPSPAMAQNWINKQQPERSEQSAALLSMGHNAPLKALEYAESDLVTQRKGVFDEFCAIGLQTKSPLSLQNQSLKAGISLPIQWLYGWVSDLIRLKLRHTQSVVNTDQVEQLQKLTHRVELSSLFDYLDQLTDAARLSQAPLNAQMVLDELMLAWQAVSNNTTTR